jgi:hypothetical protein
MTHCTTPCSIRLTRDRFLMASSSSVSGGPSSSQARINKACHHQSDVRHQKVIDEQESSFRVLYSKDMKGSSNRSFDDFSFDNFTTGTSESSSNGMLSNSLGDFGEIEANEHKKGKKLKKSYRKEQVKKGSDDEPYSLLLENEKSTIAPRSLHHRDHFESSATTESSEHDHHSCGSYQHELPKKVGVVLLTNRSRETLAEIRYLLSTLSTQQGPSIPSSRTESRRYPGAA